jgi:hypothetical protein
LPKRGVSDESCLDFDLSFIDFDRWLRTMQGERVWKPYTDEHKGQVQVPKYETMEAIFREYDTGLTPGEMVQRQQHARQELDDLIGEILTDAAPTF